MNIFILKLNITKYVFDGNNIDPIGFDLVLKVKLSITLGLVWFELLKIRFGLVEFT